ARRGPPSTTTRSSCWPCWGCWPCCLCSSTPGNKSGANRHRRQRAVPGRGPGVGQRFLRLPLLFLQDDGNRSGVVRLVADRDHRDVFALVARRERRRFVLVLALVDVKDLLELGAGGHMELPLGVLGGRAVAALVMHADGDGSRALVLVVVNVGDHAANHLFLSLLLTSLRLGKARR